jgi:hypothetical protein
MPAKLICPVCTNEFTANGRPRRTYCSTECRTKAFNSSQYLEQRTCPTCENTLDAPTTVRRIYCSPDCRKDADRRRGQGPGRRAGPPTRG